MVLLYGRNIFLATGAMLKVLEVFHNRAARWITTTADWRVEEEDWDYPQCLMHWRPWGYVRSRNTFRDGRPPSWCKWPSGQSLDPSSDPQAVWLSKPWPLRTSPTSVRSTLVGWLNILTPMVGWDIMGYESDPLLSSPELSNCSCYVNLFTPLPRLFLWFIYHVLIPPAHHPARPRHPLRLSSQWIDGAAGYPLRFGRLLSIDIHYYGVEPRGFHRHIYRWVPPLSACPAFRRHPRDLSLRPMMERRQDLEHLYSHHPALASW